MNRKRGSRDLRAFLAVAAVACALLPFPSYAQVVRTIACDSDISVFNTAYNGPDGPPLDSGLDTVWESGIGTAAGGPASVSSWILSTVGNRAPGAWIPSPYNNANWISHYTGQHVGNVDIYHRYRFNIDPAVEIDLFQLTLDFYSDNSVAAIFVNGVLQAVPGVPQGPADPYQYQGFRAGAQAAAVLGDDWVSGANTLVVQVKSGQPYQGLLVQASGDPVCRRPTLALSKTTLRAAGGPFAFSLTNTLQASGSAATSAPGSPAPVDGDGATAGIQPFSVDAANADVTITEAELGGWRIESATCTAEGVPVGTLGSGAGARTYTIPAAEVDYGREFVCSFVNEALADLRIEKSAAAPEVESGDDATYTIVVANDGPAPADGARVTDPQPQGLDCSAGTLTCGGATGGAVCPASPTVADLQGAGLIVPTLPAGGSLQFALTCTVTATGNP